MTNIFSSHSYNHLVTSTFPVLAILTEPTWCFYQHIVISTSTVVFILTQYTWRFYQHSVISTSTVVFILTQYTWRFYQKHSCQGAQNPSVRCLTFGSDINYFRSEECNQSRKHSYIIDIIITLYNYEKRQLSHLRISYSLFLRVYFVVLPRC